MSCREKRYEFTYIQNGTSFTINYDEFTGDKLFMLDVDAQTEAEKNSFIPNDFPGKGSPIKLVDVNEDKQYSGYRIAYII